MGKWSNKNLSDILWVNEVNFLAMGLCRRQHGWKYGQSIGVWLNGRSQVYYALMKFVRCHFCLKHAGHMQFCSIDMFGQGYALYNPKMISGRWWQLIGLSGIVDLFSCRCLLIKQYQACEYPLQSWMTMAVHVCFTSTHTSPDWVWDCWPWTSASKLRLARGIDLRSVSGGYVLLSTCPYESMSVIPVYSVC